MRPTTRKSAYALAENSCVTQALQLFGADSYIGEFAEPNDALYNSA
jgi:hypothetical protein